MNVAIRNIRKDEDPILRKKAKKVEKIAVPKVEYNTTDFSPTLSASQPVIKTVST